MVWEGSRTGCLACAALNNLDDGFSGICDFIETFTEVLGETEWPCLNIVEVMLHKGSKLEKEKLKGEIEQIICYQWEDNNFKYDKSCISHSAKLGNTLLIPYKFQLDLLWRFITKAQIQANFVRWIYYAK